VFGAVVAPFTWAALNWSDTVLLVLLGVTAMIAHTCINRSLSWRRLRWWCPINIRRSLGDHPGYIFFNDVPSWGMLTGAASSLRRHLHFYPRADSGKDRGERGFG